MASSASKSKAQTSGNETIDLIDPIYQKYVKSVLRSLSSTEFYEFFMDSISRAENQFQFSNRRLEKIVDTTWVESIEEALEGFQNIVSSPRNIIKEDELIVNVANAKKAGSDVVRHLAQHASLVEKFDEMTGDVRPSKLMQKYREDSWGLYENRLVFTALEQSFHFVKIRHDALFEAMGDEFGAKLKLQSDMSSATEMVHLDMFMHIKDTDSAMETDAKNGEIFARISRLYRILATLMNSRFAQQMMKLQRVKGPVTKTNVLKKNPNYKAIVKLFEFLRSYGDIGYTIKVIEQNPVIDETFERDIFHNILFNYLVLKGHLERDKDRMLPAPSKEKKRTLKPKFIKEIIEELTEDYDLPDIEIRKVLIEELTKEQLMMEEAAERRRLVEEQAQRKREEEERQRLEREAEKERLRREKEAEKERLRQEKEAEEHRLLVERMEREQEERRRSKLFKNEIEYFREHLEERLELRREVGITEEAAKQDFEDAAWILEETERIKREEAERARQRRREEKERKIREELEAQQRALREEEERKERERLEKLAEEERIRKEQEAEAERLRLEELARQEEERLQREAEDRKQVERYQFEIQRFRDQMELRQTMRREYQEALNRQKEAREQERQRRLEVRKFAGK